HGEDVKDYFFYLDNTPTHSYMKYLYKYPQAAFPYAQLVEENRRRGREAPEFDLIDTGVFDDDRYFDVFVEYAKADADDILIKMTAINRGPDQALLHLLPAIWFRNRWTWGDNGDPKPTLRKGDSPGVTAIELNHFQYGERWLYCEGTPELLFTENESNNQRLFGSSNSSPYVKDAINDYLVHGVQDAINSSQTGTKAAANYALTLQSGETATIRLRLTNKPPFTNESPITNEPWFTRNSPFRGGLPPAVFGENFEQTFADRIHEADEFYDTVIPVNLSDDARAVMRQALGGLLWSKQYYHYDVE